MKLNSYIHNLNNLQVYQFNGGKQKINKLLIAHIKFVTPQTIK